MKKNDKKQLQAMEVDELSKKAVELKKQISDERLKRQSANVKNVHIVKGLRQKLAVVYSMIQQSILEKERAKV